LNAAAISYQKGLSDAQADSNSIIAGLRAGNLRMRWQWREADGRGVSASGATVAGVDAAKRSRQESAGRIIGATEQCVAQVGALQQVIRDYLTIINGSTPSDDAQ
jgi:hypothetical protein